MTALCRTLDPAPWLDGQQDAADACGYCVTLQWCRATTRAQIMVFAIPVGVSQAGVRWPTRTLSRPAALARLQTEAAVRLLELALAELRTARKD